MIRFTIPGEPVVKKNNRPIYRAGNKPMIGKSQKLKDAELSITFQMRNEYHGPMMTGDICAEYWVYLGTKRRKDLSNCLEIFNDCMTKAGVIEDDNNIVEIAAHKLYDKDNPRVEIELSNL